MSGDEKNIKILFFGDIVGKPGRNAVKTYLENIPDFSITHTPTFHFDDDFFENPDQLSSKPFEPKTFDFDMNKAIDIAYANSPELNVLTATKNAMEQSLLYIKRTYFPELSADFCRKTECFSPFHFQPLRFRFR